MDEARVKLEAEDDLAEGRGAVFVVAHHLKNPKMRRRVSRSTAVRLGDEEESNDVKFGFYK